MWGEVLRAKLAVCFWLALQRCRAGCVIYIEAGNGRDGWPVRT